MSFLEKLFIAWIVLALIVGFVAGWFAANQDREPKKVYRGHVPPRSLPQPRSLDVPKEAESE